MPATFLKAHHDGSQIVLDEPFDLPANATLMVAVITAEDEQERDEWANFGLQNLARAYGDDEPEYSIDDCLPQ